MSLLATSKEPEHRVMQTEFQLFPNDDALSICSGLTAVLHAFTCSDSEKETALEFVLKLHRERSKKTYPPEGFIG